MQRTQLKILRYIVYYQLKNFRHSKITIGYLSCQNCKLEAPREFRAPSEFYSQAITRNKPQKIETKIPYSEFVILTAAILLLYNLDLRYIRHITYRILCIDCY